GRQNRGQGTNPRGGGAARHIARSYTQPKRTQNFDYFKDKMLLMQAQENGMAFDKEQLLFLADDCDAFDSDVDEAPTAQTMFMANMSSADPVYDEAGPSYDSDILSEIHDHDHSQDAVCEPHDENEIHDNVHLNHVVDSHADYTSNSNLILYDQSKPYYNELNKVAIGYKNPLCLTRAKQVQPALYNGYEIIKDNHVSAVVHNIDDTLEDVVCEHHEEHAMHDNIQLNHVVDSHADYTSDRNMILYDQYVKENACQEHFKGIQKALTKEIKEMKYVFEELEAEVAQNTVDRKHHEIERKNLLIVNNNIIDECLSKEVFYVATNSELTVSRFTEMHVANTTVEARCLELEDELSNLRDKSHNDNHNELVNHFPNIKVVQIIPWYLDSGCSKHMTGDRLRLMNFVKRFIRTVRFRNDHFSAIMGYGDYVIGDSVISRVYYVEGLGHNLFFVRQFCDFDLEVAFRKHSCYV
nr:integrase, catalytic region, zinc finger, CCHC-type, peptidase aspartic, catalytic [Tanacetum cinerariifolium]